MKTASVLAPIVLVLAAGCLGSPAPTTSTTAHDPGDAFTEGFDTMAVGAQPAGWTNTGATWRVAVDPSAYSPPNVMEGTGSPTKGRTSLLNTPAGAYGDFSATVRFQLLSGEHPQGAGLSFRWADEEHYTLIRYSNSEQGWHIFVADGGEVDKKSAGTLGIAGDLPQFGAWIDLRVLAHGDRIEAWWGDMKVIDYTETSPTVARSGQVGLFLRGATVALFDDLAVEPLSLPSHP